MRIKDKDHLVYFKDKIYNTSYRLMHTVDTQQHMVLFSDHPDTCKGKEHFI